MAQWTNLQEIHKFDTTVHILGKSRGLHLAEPGLTPGSLSDRRNLGEA